CDAVRLRISHCCLPGNHTFDTQRTRRQKRRQERRVANGDSALLHGRSFYKYKDYGDDACPLESGRRKEPCSNPFRLAAIASVTKPKVFPRRTISRTEGQHVGSGWR